MELLTGNECAAMAAKLAKVDCIPNYPITPQTEIIEALAKWKADGQASYEFFPMDSEHSVMSAAIGASAAGSRVFTATSSQGLMLMTEVMYIASGMRLPIVMANVSRGLSAPITLWADHDDFLSQKSAGWVMIHAQDNQEVLDSLIMAFRVAEDRRVLLPVMVNFDGYVLSYTKEPVEMLKQKDVSKFVGKYDPRHAFFRKDKPLVQGGAVLLPGDYTFFRHQHHMASMNALGVLREVQREFARKFGRNYGLVEEYCTEGANTIIVTQGSISTTAKAAVNAMRKRGKRVGLLRLRVIRPWPEKEVGEALANAKHVAMFNKDLAPGRGGIMSPEVKAAMYKAGGKAVVTDFIAGLGGNPESVGMFEYAVKLAEKDRKGEVFWLD